jgi:exodeoxyribonuclease VII small subunit
MSKAKNKEESLSFEQAVAELAAIIERIESGQAGLEDSLEQYERGMKLIGQCRATLTAAEQKIAELGVDSQGKLAVSGGEVADEESAGGSAGRGEAGTA